MEKAPIFFLYCSDIYIELLYSFNNSNTVLFLIAVPTLHALLQWVQTSGKYVEDDQLPSNILLYSYLYCKQLNM